jgi:hypothetical protein
MTILGIRAVDTHQRRGVRGGGRLTGEAGRRPARGVVEAAAGGVYEVHWVGAKLTVATSCLKDCRRRPSKMRNSAVDS